MKYGLMKTMMMTTKIGSRIRIITSSESCCGTITQGWTGVVKRIVPYSNRDRILVLGDDTLVWESQTEKVCKSGT